MAIREATREFVDAVQRFEAESVKRTSLALYDIARTIIAMRQEEPLDPADDPTIGPARRAGRRRAAARRRCCSARSASSSSSGWSRRASSSGAWSSTWREHPELQAQLRGDPRSIPAAVEEYLRLLTPYRGFARTPTRDVEIGGRLIRKDEPVALVYASANRDESRLPRARASSSSNRPNIDRHLAFGAGPHRCAGAPLATLMLR